MPKPYRILQCGISELADVLASDEMAGWRVLAILPSEYSEEPMFAGYRQIPPPPGWKMEPNEKCLERIPTIFLARVTIILES